MIYSFLRFSSLLVIFLLTSTGFCQDFEIIKSNISDHQYIEAEKKLRKIKSNNLSTQDKGIYNQQLGYVLSKLNRSDEAYDFYLLARKFYFSTNNIADAQEVNLLLAHLLNSQDNKKNDAKKFMKEYYDYALTTGNKHILAKAHKQLATMTVYEDPKKSITLYKKALNYNKSTDDIKLSTQIYNNIGTVFNEIIHKPDSALYYLNKAKLINAQLKISDEICYNYINKASSYSYLGDNKTAIDFLNKAKEVKINDFKFKTNSIIYYNLARCYDSIKDYENAFKSSQIYQKYNDSLKEELQSIAINDIQTKYEVKSLKNKLQINYILLFIGLGLLIVSILIGMLTYKNLSKKKKIIEQEKLLETQKLETTLKEQELHEIDVMLESQEKERQRIANELHDNLGSMLTTLKHNFENLKRSDTTTTAKENDLFAKTDSLIEEAYQEVRNIAHLKNLGVIGSEGLVIAVKKMAEKMSILEKLNINVIPHGLNERLENTIEVMLFRMIQELCTNIIKHSEATEVNIYLTQHNNDELNIIIEDNGKGFDPKNTVSNSGIGLKSIEKKVEQMNGTFTIDSIVSKGTTIIIDLPI
jgi:signal transduction histidine kinase